jgi:hypothetical protein
MTPLPPFKVTEGDCELCTQAVLMLKANCICPNFWSIPPYLIWISKKKCKEDFLLIFFISEKWPQIVNSRISLKYFVAQYLLKFLEFGQMQRDAN